MEPGWWTYWECLWRGFFRDWLQMVLESCFQARRWRFLCCRLQWWSIFFLLCLVTLRLGTFRLMSKTGRLDKTVEAHKYIFHVLYIFLTCSLFSSFSLNWLIVERLLDSPGILKALPFLPVVKMGLLSNGVKQAIFAPNLLSLVRKTC